VNAIPGSAKPVRLPARNPFHVQPGILFTFTPERFSRSLRNRVHLAPESAISYAHALLESFPQRCVWLRPYRCCAISGGVLYSDAGQFLADGNGNGTVASVANLGGIASQTTATGTYTVASDCSGSARVTNANGTSNYRFAVVNSGQAALFLDTDAGWTGSGVFTPQFIHGIETPADSLVGDD
jgi:hypothetical protein